MADKASKKRAPKRVTTKKRTTNSKKSTPRKKRRSKAEIRAERNKYLRLFVSNPESKGGIELVQLETKYRTLFINRFGVEKIPSLEMFNEFKNAITSVGTTATVTSDEV